MSKILVLSNNCFSNTKNNGKTLYNIFRNLIERNQICSIYFSHEDKELNIPTLCINEKLLLGLAKKQINNGNQTPMKSKVTEFKRLLRECIWLIFTSWKKSTVEFANQNDINTIFLLAGDSIFMYRIALHIQKKTGKDLVLYYTDDYYYKKYEGICGAIRKKIVSYYIEKTIKKSKDVFVISQKMKEQYDSNFGICTRLLGITFEYEKIQKREIKNNKKMTFCYIGNLGLGRLQSVLYISELINKINQKYSCEWKINIFSNYMLDDKERECVQNNEAICWNDYIDEEEVKKQIINTDYVVFAESTINEMIEVTRFSFSTKIMEYLYYGNGLISYGSEESSSVKVLKDCSTKVDDGISEDVLYDRLLNNEIRMQNQKKMIEKFCFINNQFLDSKKYIEANLV